MTYFLAEVNLLVFGSFGWLISSIFSEDMKDKPPVLPGLENTQHPHLSRGENVYYCVIKVSCFTAVCIIQSMQNTLRPSALSSNRARIQL